MTLAVVALAVVGLALGAYQVVATRGRDAVAWGLGAVALGLLVWVVR